MSLEFAFIALVKSILNKMEANFEEKNENQIPQGDRRILEMDTPQAASPHPETSPLCHLVEVETIRN